MRASATSLAYLAVVLVSATALSCGSTPAPDTTSPSSGPVEEASEEEAEDNPLEQLFARVRLQLEPGTVGRAELRRTPMGLLVGGALPGNEEMPWFLLDTAAPALLVSGLVPTDERHAMSLGETPLVDANGEETATLPVHLLAGLAVGSETVFSEVVAYEGWFEGEHPATCATEAGLIGYSVTQAGAWRVDVAGGSLAIAQRLEDLELDGFRSFPLARSEYGTMTMSVQVAGRELALAVDTGYAGDLMLDAELFEQLFDDAEPRRYGVVVGLGEARVVEVPVATTEVRLGGPDGIPLTVEVTPSASSVVGLRALAALDGFAWDLQAEQILLRPSERTSSVVPPRAIAPLWLDERVVVGVARGPALEAGVQDGDTLLAVDELDLSEPSFARYCELMLSTSTMRRVRVERDGENLDIPIAP